MTRDFAVIVSALRSTLSCCGLQCSVDFGVTDWVCLSISFAVGLAVSGTPEGGVGTGYCWLHQRPVLSRGFAEGSGGV